MKITRKEVESGIYGLVVGDALGVPFEFLSREELKRNPCADMTGCGTHGQETGVLSAESSMTLATMEGLTQSPYKQYDAVMQNFAAWLDEGAYSVSGVFDVGNTCFSAVMNYEKGIPPTQCGGRGKYDNGNGSLMRILPASLYFLAKGADERFLDDVSSLTHAHPVSRAACKIYTNVVKEILSKKDKREMFPVQNIYGQSEYSRLRDPQFYSLPESEIKSGGYVVESLEAALWCFYGTESYRDCVLKAVNLGDDTDTTAAIVGGLAGLYYGAESIPEKWLEELKGKEMIERAIRRFCDCLTT